MNKDQIKRFIEEQKIMRLATINRDGTPHLTPMWYVVLDDKIHFTTDRDSVKAKNIQRCNKVTVVIDTGIEFSTLRGIMLKGTVTENRDEKLVQQVQILKGEKYFGKGHPHYVLYMGARATLLPHNKTPDNRACYILNVDKQHSWDYIEKFSGEA